jgi:hypothetical protein
MLMTPSRLASLSDSFKERVVAVPIMEKEFTFDYHAVYLQDSANTGLPLFLEALHAVLAQSAL